MYKYKFNPNSQPKAIYDLIFNNSNIKHRNTRESNDQNKIRIPHKYRKGNCLYKLINTWNKSNNDYKMAGNDWSLKKMIKSNILDNLEVCAQKNCEICKFDASRDFIKYMSA